MGKSHSMGCSICLTLVDHVEDTSDVMPNRLGLGSSNEEESPGEIFLAKAFFFIYTLRKYKIR